MLFNWGKVYAILYTYMEETTQTNEDNGVIYEWVVEDRRTHERGWIWYLMASLVGVALITSAIVTQNFLFAILILLFAFIILLQGIIPIKKVQVGVTNPGMLVGNENFPWRNFRSFFIIYNPPYVNRLYLEKRDKKGYVGLELNDELDPYELREIMLNFLPENIDKDDEELIDMVRRIFKI